jgi:hypothetical protein
MFSSSSICMSSVESILNPKSGRVGIDSNLTKFRIPVDWTPVKSIGIHVSDRQANDRTFSRPRPRCQALSSDGCARVGCNVLFGGDSLGREARCR